MAACISVLLLVWAYSSIVLSSPLQEQTDASPQCKKTKVAVLGAGVAGITAAVSRYVYATAHTHA